MKGLIYEEESKFILTSQNYEQFYILYHPFKANNLCVNNKIVYILFILVNDKVMEKWKKNQLYVIHFHTLHDEFVLTGTYKTSHPLIYKTGKLRDH